MYEPEALKFPSLSEFSLFMQLLHLLEYDQTLCLLQLMGNGVCVIKSGSKLDIIYIGKR